MEVALLTIGILAMIGVSAFLYVSWGVHLDMTSDGRKRTTKRITFAGFLSKYAEHTWERDEEFPASHFDWPKESKIHADIIQLDGQRYFFNPVDWVRFLIWQHRNKLNVGKNLDWSIDK